MIAPVTVFATDTPSAQIILSDDTKAETITWGHMKRARFAALRKWLSRTDRHTTAHTDTSSEDGSVIADKSFSWTQTQIPHRPSPDGPPEGEPNNLPDTEHKEEKTYLLNAAHLLHQMQKAQSQEDRNLICLQRTLEVLAIAALLLFFL